MEASAMTIRDSSMTHLCRKIKEREQRAPLTFPEFTDLLGKSPRLVFRNIFQMFYDMMYSYVGEGVNEYPDDPESIDFVYYDTSRLFVEGTDQPFFADRLFANRLISHVNTFRRGIRQNRIYILEGPHGCGKSTFLNNLLMKFEQYSKTEQGATYEIVWRLDRKELGDGGASDASNLICQLRNLADKSCVGELPEVKESIFAQAGKEFLEVPCPSHDNPFLLIPKAYRRDFFDELITDEQFKRKLFKEKQYEWVFKDNPCTVCLSLYQTLLDTLDSPSKVYDMVFARRYLFDRRLGEGISVFNPGDRISKTHVLSNQLLQSQLNALLRDSNRVPYMYSRYAKTNNGIYALMDIKSNNTERFANLHGIISEGVHKVEDIEEDVNSLFLALMNPEDKQNISDTQSFSDRITNIKIPYVLDYNTEVKIFRNVFGDHIQRYFLPGSSTIWPKSSSPHGSAPGRRAWRSGYPIRASTSSTATGICSCSRWTFTRASSPHGSPKRTGKISPPRGAEESSRSPRPRATKALPEGTRSRYSVNSTPPTPRRARSSPWPWCADFSTSSATARED